MPSPFPGMDPYLEEPRLWPGVHTNLIVAFQELLNKQLRPRYVADVEERVYLAPDDDPDEEQDRIPDIWVEQRNGGKTKPGKGHANGGVAIAEPLVITTLRDDERHERRVEIRTTSTGKLVTVIELLSPSNKVAGAEGRKSFLAKRREITSSKAHWVEIDLLRQGLLSRGRGSGWTNTNTVSTSRPLICGQRVECGRFDCQNSSPWWAFHCGHQTSTLHSTFRKRLELAYERGGVCSPSRV